MLATTPSIGEMPLDAIAFCDLLARILYRCLKDQDARLHLFPCVSEHTLTISLQEERSALQEGGHRSVPLDFDMRTTGHTEERTAIRQK